ncbi:MAG: hypothetical protein ACRD2T_15895, partial [Thermoanaerobaculia bacterium]
TYCQAWLIVVFRALWKEYVRKPGSLWEKTVRFGTPPGGAGEDAEAAPATRSLRSLLLLPAALCLLGPSARGQSVLETIRYGDPLLDAHWGETYLQANHETFHDRNLVGLLDLKDGLRFLWIRDTQLFLYGKVRAYKDTEQEFWNNKAVLGPGLRLKPLPEVGFFFFAEYLFGTYYGLEGRNPNPHPQFIHGLEGGAAIWERWGALPPDTRLYFPFTRWREFYGDAIYSRYDDDNLIATFQGREGWGTIGAGPVLTDFYIGLNGAGDINRDYWNNYVEGTLGVRLRPRGEELDFKLSVELVAGRFIERHGRFDLPFDPEYLGARVELTFWFGWGGKIYYE